MKFTSVMPIHNEGDNLAYSLPSVYELNPSEVILLFDRCTDDSLPLSRKIAKHYEMEDITKFIEFKNKDDEYNFRTAFLRRYAFERASYDIILNSDADVVLDQSLKEYFGLLGVDDIGLISFGYLDYPYNLQSFIRTIISDFHPLIGFSGQYAFLKRAWEETEDLESLKKIDRAEDTHLQLSIKKRYRTLHKNTKSIGLRTVETRNKHFKRGIANWELLHRSTFRVFLQSVIFMRPALMAGYFYARYKYKKSE